MNSAKSGGVERVVQRQHRHPVAQFGEAAVRRAAHPVRWRIGTDQLRKPRLDLVVAPAQRVVVGVGDLGRVAFVIGAVVMRDLGGQALRVPPAASVSVSSSTGFIAASVGSSVSGWAVVGVGITVEGGRASWRAAPAAARGGPGGGIGLRIGVRPGDLVGGPGRLRRSHLAARRPAPAQRPAAAAAGLMPAPPATRRLPRHVRRRGAAEAGARGDRRVDRQHRKHVLR